MLSCKQASQLLSQKMDRKLMWHERFALHLHLMVCDMCRRFGRQLEQMRRMVQRLAGRVEQDEAIRLPAEARERITRVLESRQL